MFKPVSAKEERLLPVYVYGSESLEHQAQISRGKGFMLFPFVTAEKVFLQTTTMFRTKFKAVILCTLLPQHQIHINPSLFHGKQTTSLWADML